MQGFNCIHQVAGSFITKIWSMVPGLWPWWYVCAGLFSRVWLFVTLWTVARQALLSMGFSRREYWSGLSCSPPEDLPNPGTEPVSLTSSALAGGFFTTGATWEALTLVEASRKMLVTQRDAHVWAGLQSFCHFQWDPLQDSLHLRDSRAAGIFSQGARTAAPWTY